KGCSSRRNCVCLSFGMVFGLCLAGIFFYSLLPKDKYRNNTQNIMKIIRLEGLRNKTQNSTLSYFNSAPKTEQSMFPSTTISLENSVEEIHENNDVSEE
ncbi:hypothetical protein KR200_004846, partial [Drosophila serrata]